MGVRFPLGAHMEKENLILVNAFAANSIILKGLIDYLNNFFKVYYIDLPGFTKKEAKLSKITLNNYSKYLENKINELSLDHFVLGGISFGFIVASNTKLDERCKGIFAFEPYTNSKSLLLNKIIIKFITSLIDVVLTFRYQDTIWKSKLFWKFLSTIHYPPPKIIPIIRETIDPETFFKVGKIIFKNTKRINFYSKPYVVLVNKYDGIVSPDYTVDLFQNNVKNLLIFELDSVHYSDDLSEKYFEKIFPPEKMKEAVNFFASNLIK